jgi:hypothetical protein
MAVRLTEEAFRRLSAHRHTDHVVFDQMRELIEAADDDPQTGLPVTDFLADVAAPGLPVVTAKRLARALQGIEVDDDARLSFRLLRNRSSVPHVVLQLHYPRDLAGGRANATIFCLGVLLRQSSGELK